MKDIQRVRSTLLANSLTHPKSLTPPTESLLNITRLPFPEASAAATVVTAVTRPSDADCRDAGDFKFPSDSETASILMTMAWVGTTRA
jgi:hypothetical protein